MRMAGALLWLLLGSDVAAQGVPASTADERAREEQEAAQQEQRVAIIRRLWQSNRPGKAAPGRARQQAFARSLRQVQSAYLEETRANGLEIEDPRVRDEKILSVKKWMAATPSALARSADAAATNPRGASLVERSGLTDFLSLALGGSNLVSADDTAVTLNLNAAGLFQSEAAECETEACDYQARGFWNQVGGSVTFGAKIPEEEITGFSGFPNADQLFDVLVWDVKVRFGDRDPRARHWEPLLAEFGRLGHFDSTFLTLRDHPLDPTYLRDLRDALQAMGEDRVQTIARSWVVSVKFSGQHLTEERGMNKYVGAVLADKGLGPLNLTLNASYGAVQGVGELTGRTYTLKEWKGAAGLGGTLWRNRLVKDRGAELLVSAEFLAPHDGADVPLDRKTTWKADATLRVPVSKALDVPLSLTYTNDPNNLSKAKYVRGLLGISYDFGALKRLVEGGEE